LGDYYLDPLKVVGLEGLWGLLITIIMLVIFQQIHCKSEQLCYYGRLEDTTRAFQDFGANWVILLLSVLICFSIASFNAFGVTVTKNASSAQRSTIDTSRTVLVWIFQLATRQEKFKVLQKPFMLNFNSFGIYLIYFFVSFCEKKIKIEILTTRTVRDLFILVANKLGMSFSI
jgi:hypothetical protein